MSSSDLFAGFRCVHLSTDWRHLSAQNHLSGRHRPLAGSDPQPELQIAGGGLTHLRTGLAHRHCGRNAAQIRGFSKGQHWHRSLQAGVRHSRGEEVPLSGKVIEI